MNELVENLGRAGWSKFIMNLPSWRSAWGAILAVLVALTLLDPARLGEHLSPLPPARWPGPLPISPSR